MKEKLYFFLSQGLSPHQLGLAVSVGLCIGIIPVLGVTSLLCAVLALRLHLNMALIQVVNYLVYPLQLLLFIPFFQAGTVFSGQEFLYSLSEIQQMMTQHPWDTLVLFCEANAYALVAWAILSPFLIGLVYIFSIFLFKHLLRNRVV